jgi:hypothetical protein
MHRDDDITARPSGQVINRPAVVSYARARLRKALLALADVTDNADVDTLAAKVRALKAAVSGVRRAEWRTRRQ